MTAVRKFYCCNNGDQIVAGVDEVICCSVSACRCAASDWSISDTRDLVLYYETRDIIDIIMSATSGVLHTHQLSRTVYDSARDMVTCT